jgi:hypothetical protein
VAIAPAVVRQDDVVAMVQEAADPALCNHLNFIIIKNDHGQQTAKHDSSPISNMMYDVVGGVEYGRARPAQGTPGNPTWP